jgi:hypothetical protein
MTYGLQIKRGDASVLVDLQTTVGGGIFVDSFTVAYNANETKTYPDVPGHQYLKVLVAQGGQHAISKTTNGSGQAVLSVLSTYNAAYSLSTQSTTVYVFATLTSEPDYGVLFVNDNGERTISALYPTPWFLGSVTTSGSGPGEYTATTSVGAGFPRFILWELPDTTDTCWFGTSSAGATAFVSSGVSGTYTVGIYAYGTPPSAPKAYIFAATAVATPSDAYGIRIRDYSGAVTFDSGTDHLSIKSAPDIAFTDKSLPESTYTFSEMSGITPAISVPSYSGGISEFISYDPLNGTYLWQVISYWGVIRKNSSNVYTKVMSQNLYTSPAAYIWQDGINSPLFTFIVDTSLYS